MVEGEELLEFVLTMKEKPLKSFCNAIKLLYAAEKPNEDKEIKKLKKAKDILKKYGPIANTNYEIPVDIRNYNGVNSFEDLNYAEAFIKHKLLGIKENKYNTLKLEIADALVKIQPNFKSQSAFLLYIQRTFDIPRR